MIALPKEIYARIYALCEAGENKSDSFAPILHGLLHAVCKIQRERDSGELITGALQKPLFIPEQPNYLPKEKHEHVKPAETH